jgi:ankyrin repeat protein
MAAAWRGDAESVRLLLEAGAAVDPPDRTPDSIRDPMLKAYLARGGEVKTTTPLIAAIDLGHVDVVRELLKYKPDLSRTNSEKQTALNIARKKQNDQIERMLREAGASSGPIGPVELLVAANEGNVQGVRAALDAGIPVDTYGGISSGPTSDWDSYVQGALPPDFYGLTALMIAARNGHADAARLLIERGADVNARARPSHRQPALYFAASKGHVEVMRLLLDAGADPSSTGQLASGKPIATPLFAAVDGGHVEAVRLLLERGARTDLKSSDIAGVMTPLELAISYDRTEIADILKKAGR